MTLSAYGVVGVGSMQYRDINGSHHLPITVVPLTITIAWICPGCFSVDPATQESLFTYI